LQIDLQPLSPSGRTSFYELRVAQVFQLPKLDNPMCSETLHFPKRMGFQAQFGTRIGHGWAVRLHTHMTARVSLPSLALEIAKQ